MLLLIAGACSRTDAAPPRQADTPLSPHAAAGLAARDLANSSATLNAIYASHFAHGQRTENDSSDKWYTAELSRLMREDAAGGAAQCGVGFLDFDPLTSAQDNVESFALGEARARADTVLVPVRIHSAYPAPKGTDELMTVAMVREAARWRIANFVHTEWDLLSGLKRSVAELRAAPKVDCSTPPTEQADTVRPRSPSGVRP